jgi:arylsulfatase
LFDAGMRGSKGTSYQGGTRVPCFFRWPAGGIPAGGECEALSAHLDLFPTLAEITGGTVPDSAKNQVEGKSLLSLLKNPTSHWPERTLVHHVGRWERGQVEKGKYQKMSIQNSRFTLVNNQELFDLKADPGEKTNVIGKHPEIAAQLRAVYEQWWVDVQPLLVNEAIDGPKQNPMKVLYWKQFGGEPTNQNSPATPKQKQRKKAKADS